MQNSKTNYYKATSLPVDPKLWMKAAKHSLQSRIPREEDIILSRRCAKRMGPSKALKTNTFLLKYGQLLCLSREEDYVSSFINLEFRKIEFVKVMPKIESFDYAIRIFGIESFTDIFISGLDEVQIWRDSLNRFAVFTDIHERFKATKQIGKGSFGQVFLLENTKSKDFFAAKVFSKDRVEKAKNGIDILLNEIRMLRKLHHRYIISLKEVHETENSIYLITDFIDGKPIMNTLQLKRIEYRHRKKFLAQISEALAYIANLSIAHRDIKPDNILVAKDYSSIKIIDFGLSSGPESTLNIKKSKAGSPGFIAPELLMCNERDSLTLNSAGFDVFSLGVLYFCMMFGMHPFEAESWRLILERNKECEVRFPDNPQMQGLFDVTDAEIQLVKRMLEKNPSERITPLEIVDSDFLFDEILRQDNELTEETEASQLNIASPCNTSRTFKFMESKVSQSEKNTLITNTFPY